MKILKIFKKKSNPNNWTLIAVVNDCRTRADSKISKKEEIDGTI